MAKRDKRVKVNELMIKLSDYGKTQETQSR